MADYTIIEDTSRALLKLLRESLCPDPVASPESIQLVSPNDKNGDFQLGLYLYDLRELSEYRNTSRVRVNDYLLSRAPSPLMLFYVLFNNSKAQIAAGAEKEQRILGRAIQALMDKAELDLSGSNPYLPAGEDAAVLALQNLSFEDKTKIWTALQSPYQIGVYFTVSPVLLSPRKQDEVVRVTSADIETEIISIP